MQFSLDGNTVSKALTKLNQLAGKDITELTLRANDATLEIHAVGLQRRSLIRVPANVQDSGIINIEKIKFAGICKGRKQLDFTINKSGLQFTTPTGYRGRDISVLPFKDSKLLKIDLQNHIPTHIQAKLLPAIKSCLITSVFGGQELGLTLLLNRRDFIIVVADAYHAAIAKFALNKSEYRKLQKSGMADIMVLPVLYAELLSRQFSRDGLLLQVNNKKIVLANNEIQVELPALQSNSSMYQHATKLDADFDSNFVLLPEAQRIAGILNNLKVLGKSKEPIILRLRKQDKNLRIIYNAVNSGRIDDSLALDSASNVTADLYLEPNNYYDVARKLNGQTRIAFNKHIVRFTSQHEGVDVSYYSSQIQRPK